MVRRFSPDKSRIIKWYFGDSLPVPPGLRVEDGKIKTKTNILIADFVSFFGEYKFW